MNTFMLSIIKDLNNNYSTFELIVALITEIEGYNKHNLCNLDTNSLLKDVRTELEQKE